MSRRPRPASLRPPVYRAAALAGVVLAVGCTTDKLGTGARCARNSECAAPLVCRLDRCRRECNTTRDCPVGLACVLDGQGLGACQVPEDKSCRRPSDCASPLLCRFQQCVNACNDSRDCPAGSSCQTDSDGNRACIDPSGKACVYHEECAPTGQTCALDGRCREECVNDRDCRYGSFCCDTGDRLCHEQGDVCGPPRVDMGPADSGGVAPMRDGGPGDGGTGPAPGLPADTVLALSCHGETTCANLGAGGTFCWGRNDHGQSGTGSTSAGEPLPLPVASPSGAMVYFGATIVCDGDACCAGGDSAAGTRYYCWGRFAEFDTGVVGDHPTPVPVPGVPEQGVGTVAVASASAGGPPTFAVSFGDPLPEPPGWMYGTWLWGDNTYGQLGDGTTTASPTPRLVDLGGTPTGQVVRLGEGFACVKRFSPAGLLCWGRNDDGQLARGTMTPMEPTPQPAMLPGDLEEVRLGRAHGCVGSVVEGLRCWGRGLEGQIGDGTDTDRPVPVPVIPTGDRPTPLFDCGGDACCAALPEMGRPFACWGQGPEISSNVPTRIPPLPGVTDPMFWGAGVCVGRTHACVVVRHFSMPGTDRVFCWGDNTYGQLGDGTMGGMSSTPVEVVRAP